MKRIKDMLNYKIEELKKSRNNVHENSIWAVNMSIKELQEVLDFVTGCMEYNEVPIINKEGNK